MEYAATQAGWSRIAAFPDVGDQQPHAETLAYPSQHQHAAARDLCAVGVIVGMDTKSLRWPDAAPEPAAEPPLLDTLHLLEPHRVSAGSPSLTVAMERMERTLEVGVGPLFPGLTGRCLRYPPTAHTAPRVQTRKPWRESVWVHLSPL
ncbi:hypothetical protein BHS06_19355 [Myxococcus xanthus]|nr:hypothetical protein BHS06_19355 [Myxococcus xanthus]